MWKIWFFIDDWIVDPIWTKILHLRGKHTSWCCKRYLACCCGLSNPQAHNRNFH